VRVRLQELDASVSVALRARPSAPTALHRPPGVLEPDSGGTSSSNPGDNISDSSQRLQFGPVAVLCGPTSGRLEPHGVPAAIAQPTHESHKSRQQFNRDAETVDVTGTSGDIQRRARSSNGHGHRSLVGPHNGLDGDCASKRIFMTPQLILLELKLAAVAILRVSPLLPPSHPSPCRRILPQPLQRAQNPTPPSQGQGQQGCNHAKREPAADTDIRNWHAGCMSLSVEESMTGYRSG